MRIDSADGETRTLTGGVLSAVPLPLGYVGGLVQFIGLEPIGGHSVGKSRTKTKKLGRFCESVGHNRQRI